MAGKLLDLFSHWLTAGAPGSNPPIAAAQMFREQSGKRGLALKILGQLLLDHYVGQEVIQKIGGFPKAAAVLRNSLPTKKRIRSGDLAELIATEYVDSQTTYRVPIRKLRWKDDRDTALRGNDLIAIDKTRKAPRVLKGECKSRKYLGPAVMKEAMAALEAHNGRPNPSTLGFIMKRLVELDRLAEAEAFERLQAGPIRANHLEHIVFTLSGNEPTDAFAAAPAAAKRIARRFVGVTIDDHEDFIESVFSIYAAQP